MPTTESALAPPTRDMQVKLPGVALGDGSGATPAWGIQDRLRLERLAKVARILGGRRAVLAAFAGAMVTGLWVTFFTVGLAIPTSPFRDRLLSMASPDTPPAEASPGVLESIAVIALAYTPTNLALLCVFAALAGCLGRLATTNDSAAEQAMISRTRDLPPSADPAKHAPGGAASGEGREALVSPLAPAISAVTWGFFIYLVLISGTVVLAGDPFKETSPEQYLRLAGSASLLAFAVGWQPQIVAQLVGTIGNGKLLKQQ